MMPLKIRGFLGQEHSLATAKSGDVILIQDDENSKLKIARASMLPYE